MSANESETPTYRLEHDRVSDGVMTDPLEGTDHPIEDGEFEITNAASAAILTQNSVNVSFAGPRPSEKEIEKARKEHLGDWATSEIVYAFEESRNRIPGELEDMGVEYGFDPEFDRAYNDPRMRIAKTYNRLLDEDCDLEAEYLRHLPSTDEQDRFRQFLQNPPEGNQKGRLRELVGEVFGSGF